jgi:lysophospholipase L1-like esterase
VAVLVALALGLCLLGAATARAGLMWETVPGLSTSGPEAQMTGAITPAQAIQDGVALRLTLTGDTCGADWRATRFTLDGAPLAAQPDASAVCSFVSHPVSEGQHQLAAGEQAPQEIDVVRYLIASLGDSVASGEGNPDRRADLSKAQWQNRPCHRSLRSGAALASLAVERSSSTSSVALLALGCSGATIPVGLEAPYDGIEPDRHRTTEPPQLDVLNALAGRVDAVLLSVGANDVYFSKIVQFCALVSDCPHRHFDPQRPLMLGKASAPTLDAAIAERLHELARRYDRLDDEIASTIPRERIVISQYYDPTIGTGAAFCKVHMGPGTIDAHEAQWAHTRVLGALNAVVAQAARAHHWTLVDGVQEAFAGHGICAKQDQVWARTLAQSYLWQDARLAFSSIAGTLHPNRSGHRAIGHLIEPKLARVLGTTVTPDPPDAPDAPDHRLLGIRVTLLLWIGGVLVALGLAVAGVAVVRASVLASEAGNG